jgi:predicted proteasome-type protease
MTLTIALQGCDGLLLAADSRGTIGDPRGLTAINDDQRKIFKLSHHCGVATAGSSELAMKLVDEINRRMRTDDPTGKTAPDDADAVMGLTRETARACYGDWFGKFPLDQRPVINFLLAGYAAGTSNRLDVPRIYLLASQIDFAPQLCARQMLAGVPQYAIYLLHRLYDQTMTIENLLSLAVYLINETATQDPKVGGPVRIATIRPGKGFQETDEKTIGKIVKRNARAIARLRESFFKGIPYARKDKG